MVYAPGMPTATTTCTPTGRMPAPTLPEYRCADPACGVPLTHKWTADGRDFTDVGPDGMPGTDHAPPGYHEDPKGWWDRLAASDPATYSVLSATAGLGCLFWHAHRPVAVTAPVNDVPTCCGWPMRATRDGWLCRENPATFVPYQAAA